MHDLQKKSITKVPVITWEINGLIVVTISTEVNESELIDCYWGNLSLAKASSLWK